MALCPCDAVEWERSRDRVGWLVFLTVLAGEAGVAPLRNELTWRGRESRGLSRSALYSCVVWIVYSELLFQHKKKTYQPQRLCPFMAEPPTPACPPASSQTHSGTCLEKELGSGPSQCHRPGSSLHLGGGGACSAHECSCMISRFLERTQVVALASV